MYTVLISLHVIICFIMMVVVLLQTGKGTGLSSAFGGAGGAQTIFGGRGAATFLNKLTTALAVIFMLTSLTLTLLSAQKSATDSVIRREAERRPSVSSPPAVRPFSPEAISSTEEAPVPPEETSTESE